jgi:hypothetical protein
MCEDWKKEARRLREEKSIIEVVPTIDGDYENEGMLRISHNGYQFTAVVVSRTEAERVISALKEYYGI